jgi:hypothetical protein
LPIRINTFHPETEAKKHAEGLHDALHDKIDALHEKVDALLALLTQRPEEPPADAPNPPPQ